MRPNLPSPFDRPVYEDLTDTQHPSFLTNLETQNRFRRELESEFRPDARDWGKVKRDVIYAASQPIDTGHEDAIPTHAIQAAYHRLHVQRELWSKFRRVGSRGLRREIDLFEVAIAQLETKYAGAEQSLSCLAAAEPLDSEERSGTIDIDLSDSRCDIAPARRKRTKFWAGMLVIAAMLVSSFYARDRFLAAFDLLWRESRLAAKPLPQTRGISDERHTSDVATSLAQSASYTPRPAGPSGSSISLPDAYGMYAVNNNHPMRLEALRMRVPDTRIALPGVITQPSPVVLPNGQLSFIAYQRDLTTSTPDSASIRIVAKVVRALTFAATGKPTITKLEDTWAVRDVSVDLTVAPVPGNQEMVWIRLKDQKSSLSPGRYMLVFKNQAYDFAVEGSINDTAQCLERAETQNGTIYSECREIPDTVNVNSTWRNSALPPAVRAD